MRRRARAGRALRSASLPFAPFVFAKSTILSLAHRWAVCNLMGLKFGRMTWRLFDHLYYIAHRRNLGSILARGILSHNEVERLQIERIDISDPDVQRWRGRCEPVFGRSIHDYVPLYMNPRNPMLCKLQRRQADLVILAVSTDAVRGPDRLFSDGNAASRSTRFSDHSGVLRGAIDVLSADRWDGFEDGGRRRCAEALVLRHVAPVHICKVLCHSAASAQAVQSEHAIAAEPDQSFFFRP